MALDISKLARMGEFGMELESLGLVNCLSLTTGHLSQGDKELRTPNVDSHTFARWLFGELAQRPVKGDSGEDDPSEGTSLATDELNSVTDGELEEFADKLIQKNRYLLKAYKGGGIEKSADESACEFLVRAFRPHAAEKKAKWEQLDYRLMEPLIPKNPIHETNEKLENVVEQIEGLRPMAANAEQLFRENAATAGRQAKIAIGIAVVGLLISAVGLAISSFFSYQSYVDAKVSGEKSDAQIKAFQKEIRDLAAAQREEQAILAKAIGDARHVSPAAVKK